MKTQKLAINKQTVSKFNGSATEAFGMPTVISQFIMPTVISQ
ncbi:hypothetical protein [Pseudarcicella hirudinis]